jgi:hypothetical protein
MVYRYEYVPGGNAYRRKTRGQRWGYKTPVSERVRKCRQKKPANERAVYLAVHNVRRKLAECQQLPLKHKELVARFARIKPGRKVSYVPVGSTVTQPVFFGTVESVWRSSCKGDEFIILKRERKDIFEDKRLSKKVALPVSHVFP